MQRRSWIILVICLVLAAGLFVAYIATQRGPTAFTQQDAIDVTQKMAQAFHDKDTTGVMAYVSQSPDTRLAGLTPDQARVLLARYFRNAEQVSADMRNYAFVSGDNDATLQFDLALNNNGGDSKNTDYAAHIVVHFRRVDVPHLLGIYQTKEWRVAGIESTGPDLSTYGD
ncbi:MAG TPA: hypothetical protein VKT77_01425 [Chthonomonadaceae bacterium]|nr:hypothetical protein [Chthonomonadaceae bacterium]